MLTRKQLAPGAGARPNVVLPGFDGHGVTIALLDTGVDAAHPYLLGQVEDGIDLIAPQGDAGASASPEDPTSFERHGTQLAGVLVGSEGPAGMNGVASGATVIPIRVAGWQREAGGRWAVFGRTDQLVAGLERAVDPNADGVAHDAARIALVGVAAPFAAFEDSPSARAVAGALRLDTLVVTPAGNDGVAGPGYGSISGPGGSRAALTAGAVAPASSLFLRLAAPKLARAGTSARVPPKVVDFFDENGFSVVAGRAALVPAGSDPA